MKKFFTLLCAVLISANFIYAQHSLPPLNYAYTALQPYIDAQTMEIHYTKHHQAYVNNLNKALEGSRAAALPIDELLIAAERRGAAIRNNGGGHYNHTLFWEILSPTPKKAPTGALASAINETFTSLDSLKKAMNAGAAARFGSGWVWLYVNPAKKLAVCTSPNQDNPIMDASGEHRGIPVLGIDVWEHAYYLQYQNRRNDYLQYVWEVIDWAAVEKKYEAALKSPLLKLIEKDTWTELKQFHTVMAQTFHPMEDGNLTPIKTRSAEMVAKAKAVKTGNTPASFRTPEINKAIDELVMGSEALHKLVTSKAKDNKIVDSLTKLHDTFHVIQGLCSDDH